MSWHSQAVVGPEGVAGKVLMLSLSPWVNLQHELMRYRVRLNHHQNPPSLTNVDENCAPLHKKPVSTTG